MTKEVSCGVVSDEKNPVYFTCTVLNPDGSICGKMCKCDMGIDAEIRYPCPKHYREIIDKIEARFGRKGAKL